MITLALALLASAHAVDCSAPLAGGAETFEVRSTRPFDLTDLVSRHQLKSQLHPRQKPGAGLRERQIWVAHPEITEFAISADGALGLAAFETGEVVSIGAAGETKVLFTRPGGAEAYAQYAVRPVTHLAFVDDRRFVFHDARYRIIDHPGDAGFSIFDVRRPPADRAPVPFAPGAEPPFAAGGGRAFFTTEHGRRLNAVDLDAPVPPVTIRKMAHFAALALSPAGQRIAALGYGDFRNRLVFGATSARRLTEIPLPSEFDQALDLDATRSGLAALRFKDERTLAFAVNPRGGSPWILELDLTSRELGRALAFPGGLELVGLSNEGHLAILTDRAEAHASSPATYVYDLAGPTPVKVFTDRAGADPSLVRLSEARRRIWLPTKNGRVRWVEY